MYRVPIKRDNSDDRFMEWWFETDLLVEMIVVANDGHVLRALYLDRSTARLGAEEVDEAPPKCRYCGSPDVAQCGFRCNAR